MDCPSIAFAVFAFVPRVGIAAAAVATAGEEYASDATTTPDDNADAMRNPVGLVTGTGKQQIDQEKLSLMCQSSVGGVVIAKQSRHQTSKQHGVRAKASGFVQLLWTT